MKRAFLAPTLAFAAMTGDAFACACCAEPGYRATSSFQMQDWLEREIARVKIDDTAHLYLNSCGLDCVRGIDMPQESYDSRLEISEGVWQLSFSTADVPSGTLRWTTPDRLTFFRVDQSPKAGSGDATLYGEVRMNIDVVGTGIFAPSLMPAELVFTGESNACLDSSRMRHWHLSVGAKDARFKFFGNLALVPQ